MLNDEFDPGVRASGDENGGDYEGDPTELTVGQFQEMIEAGVLDGTVWSGDHNGPIPEE